MFKRKSAPAIPAAPLPRWKRILRWIRRGVVLVLLAWVILTIYISSNTPPAELRFGPATTAEPAAAPLAPAPALIAERLGGALSDEQLWHGDSRLVVFWAPWCGICKNELPTLEKASLTLGKTLRIVAVATSYESRNEAIQVARNAGMLHVELLFDADGGLAKQYGISAFPTAFLIDRFGIVRLRYTGGRDWSSDEALDDCRKVAAIDASGYPAK